MKKMFIIWLPLVMFFVSLFLGLLCCVLYDIDEELKEIFVQINITILGFAITAFSIIIGFMKENEQIKMVMAKGHLKRCIISIILLTITAIISTLSVIFKDAINIIFICSLNCYFQLIFIVYFILILGYYSLKK
ncbi:MAG: hypothetical protein K2I77_05170 [Anaeroplasmataceae bacterium]|nr:hypothetical protein [Anaeroplasmataceae bacterium]